jgi:hypothetical protein
MANVPQAGEYGVLLLKKRNWFKGFFITLISWGTRSPAYHAVLVVNAPTGGLAIVEAEPGGAILSPVDRHTNVVWSNLGLTPEQRVAVSDAGLKFIGREYSFYDDAYLGITRVFRLRGWKRVWKFLSRGESVECAQLVDAAELAGGVHLFNDGRQTGQVAPSDLYDLILKGN